VIGSSLTPATWHKLLLMLLPKWTETSFVHAERDATVSFFLCSAASHHDLHVEMARNQVFSVHADDATCSHSLHFFSGSAWVRKKSPLSTVIGS